MSPFDLVPGKTGADKGKPLTGWKVLAMLLAFFGVVGAVNAVMVYSALSTFSGEVEAHPYEHGLAYNREYCQRARTGGARLEGRRLAGATVLGRDADISFGARRRRRRYFRRGGRREFRLLPPIKSRMRQRSWWRSRRGGSRPASSWRRARAISC